MWIGVLLLGDAGMRAGRVEAISHDEFFGNFSRNGYIYISFA
jgi:hypothetical protein